MKKSAFVSWSGLAVFCLFLALVLAWTACPGVAAEKNGPGMRGRGRMAPPDGVKEEIDKLAPEQREELGRLRALSETYRKLADIAKEDGKIDEAISFAKKILALELPEFAPEGVKKMANRGKGMVNMFIYNVLAEAGREKEAAAYLEAAGKSDLPEFMTGEMYNKMGEKLLKEGNREKAREYFEKAAKILEK